MRWRRKPDLSVRASNELSDMRPSTVDGSPKTSRVRMFGGVLIETRTLAAVSRSSTASSTPVLPVPTTSTCRPAKGLAFL